MIIFYYFIYLIYLIIPLLIIGLIVHSIFRAIGGRSKKGLKEKEWYLKLFLSKEDAVSQFFFHTLSSCSCSRKRNEI